MPSQAFPTRRLGGNSGITVSALGLGCMGMSYAYGPADESEAMVVLRRYLELGGNFLDTAEIYGPYANEELLGKFLKDVPREEYVVATKFGFKVVNGKNTGQTDSSPANVHKVIDECLSRLGLDFVDLFYQHRVDPNTPIEETVGAMAELVAAGKIRALGLSEASPETLRRACAVHPIAALQTEYSLWSREPEREILATCRNLDIAFIPYSPLGRGFLTGSITKVDDMDPSDWRRTNPRFAEEALAANLKLVEGIRDLAGRKDCTPAQLALAWVLAQGEDLIPIPGTKRLKYLEENMGAVRVRLSESDLAEIDRLTREVDVVGERYTKSMMGMIDQ